MNAFGPMKRHFETFGCVFMALSTVSMIIAGCRHSTTEWFGWAGIAVFLIVASFIMFTVNLIIKIKKSVH